MPGAMTPQKLVLRDIHVPPEPSWWPPAPGWWVLALTLLLVLGWLTWALARQHRRHRAFRQVMAEVDRLDARHVDDDQALAYGLHQLLRRMARRFAANAVSERGEPWRQTLARVPVKAPVLDVLAGLERQIYRPAGDFDRARAIAATRTWLATAWRKMPDGRGGRPHA